MAIVSWEDIDFDELREFRDSGEHGIILGAYLSLDGLYFCDTFSKAERLALAKGLAYGWLHNDVMESAGRCPACGAVLERTGRPRVYFCRYCKGG